MGFTGWLETALQRFLQRFVTKDKSSSRADEWLKCSKDPAAVGWNSCAPSLPGGFLDPSQSGFLVPSHLWLTLMPMGVQSTALLTSVLDSPLTCLCLHSSSCWVKSNWSKIQTGSAIICLNSSFYSMLSFTKAHLHAGSGVWLWLRSPLMRF